MKQTSQQPMQKINTHVRNKCWIFLERQQDVLMQRIKYVSKRWTKAQMSDVLPEY